MRSRRPCMGEFMRLGACNMIELIPAHKDALYKLVSWITDSEAVCMLPKHFNNPGSFHFKLILERTRQYTYVSSFNSHKSICSYIVTYTGVRRTYIQKYTHAYTGTYIQSVHIMQYIHTLTYYTHNICMLVSTYFHTYKHTLIHTPTHTRRYTYADTLLYIDAYTCIYACIFHSLDPSLKFANCSISIGFPPFWNKLLAVLRVLRQISDPSYINLSKSHHLLSLHGSVTPN